MACVVVLALVLGLMGQSTMETGIRMFDMETVPMRLLTIALSSKASGLTTTSMATVSKFREMELS